MTARGQRYSGRCRHYSEAGAQAQSECSNSNLVQHATDRRLMQTWLRVVAYAMEVEAYLRSGRTDTQTGLYTRVTYGCSMIPVQQATGKAAVQAVTRLLLCGCNVWW